MATAHSDMKKAIMRKKAGQRKGRVAQQPRGEEKRVSTSSPRRLEEGGTNHKPAGFLGAGRLRLKVPLQVVLAACCHLSPVLQQTSAANTLVSKALVKGWEMGSIL